MKHALLIFFVSLLAYTLTAGGHLYSIDEEIMYRTTASIAEDQDLAIEPVIRNFGTRTGIDGNEYAQYGVGQPFLAVPFYFLGKSLAPHLPIETWTTAYGLPSHEVEGWWGKQASAVDLATRVAISFFNILASAILAALVCLLLQELTGETRASLFASFLYALGSVAWAHSRPFYSEIAAVLFIVLAWYALFRACRGNMTGWTLLAGAATGYAALVRMDSVIMYPATGLLLLGPIWKAARVQKPKIHPYIVFCLPALLCGGVLLWLNKTHFGGWLEMGYEDQTEGIRFSTPLIAGLYGFLFSAGRGMFFFSPALILGLFGWRVLFNRDRWIMLAVFFATVFPVCFMAKWQNWAGGWTWGPRHIFMVHPFLVIPTAFWLMDGWNATRRAVAYIVLILGIGAQLVGTSQDFVAYYQLYFRNMNGRFFRELYDIYDAEYWGQYYRLYRLNPEGGEETILPLGFLPAPVQHSIYVPQYSAWRAYPMMMTRYGMFDNMWWRLFFQPDPGEASSSTEEQEETGNTDTAGTPEVETETSVNPAPDPTEDSPPGQSPDPSAVNGTP